MTNTAWSSRRPRPRALLLGGFGLVVVVALLTLGLVTMAWGDGLREEQRLLPGTTVASVEVGDRTVEDAVAVVRDRLAEDLDRPVDVVLDDRTWTTSGRQLGATSDVEQVVASAFERTTNAGLVDLARLRFGSGGANAHELAIDVPDDAVAAFVADVAEEVDTAPGDAVLAWADGGVQLEEAVTGVRVQRQEAAAAIEAAIAEGAETVELPVEEQAPEFGTEEARRVADEVTEAVDAALAHEVTVVLEDTTRTVTPRELGAGHNAPALLETGGADRDDVVLDLPDTGLDEVVAEVAAGHEHPSRDASLAWSKGSGFSVTPEQTGLGVDREAARSDLRAALEGAGDRVELDLQTTHPGITTDRFDQVLLVRQAERRVELYRGGEVARSWDVAVGTGNHPTPTGMFTVGAKRFEPTWHNPSPNSWGDDLPASIGPGPDNPLGLRALNWMQGGHDTLIRFHGTANEDSIGRAASHGCVRMRNADVIELYDLVPSGTVIVSVAG